jgi:hypothetical protein
VADKFEFDYVETVSFMAVLDEMRESLHLTDQELYEGAKVSRSYYNKLVWKTGRHRIGKGFVFAFALVLIKTDMGNKPPQMGPEARMDKLLKAADYASLDTRYFKENQVICWCLTEGIFDVADVNDYLDQMRLPILPNGDVD